jgi:hypothetical protein
MIPSLVWSRPLGSPTLALLIFGFLRILLGDGVDVSAPTFMPLSE